MPKRTTIVDLGNGQVGRRTSDAWYTHVVVATYTDADKARDLAIAERDLRAAQRDLTEMEVALADPAEVAEYRRLLEVARTTDEAARAARAAYEGNMEADAARQRALGYGVPGAPLVMLGGTPESDRLRRAAGNAEADAYTAASAVRQNLLADEGRVRRALDGAKAALAQVAALATGPSTAQAFSWHTSPAAAKRGCQNARRAGYTAAIKVAREERPQS